LSLSEKFYSSKEPKFKHLGETELSCKGKNYVLAVPLWADFIVFYLLLM